MARMQRKVSSENIYHIIIRGSGQQLIFEDEDDRILFLKLLDRYLEELDGEVFAWILMTNHVHLVLHMMIDEVSLLMRKMGATYFANFNKKTERVGHVLQGRFFSEPINSDEYLMTCIRYVHQNMEKAGVCTMEETEWSSYHVYVGNSSRTYPIRTETAFPLAVFDGPDNFEIYHSQRNYAVPCIDLGKSRNRMSDEEALVYAKSLIGETELLHLKELEKPSRDALLVKLKNSDLALRQIARLTGLGLKVVRNA